MMIVHTMCMLGTLTPIQQWLRRTRIPRPTGDETDPLLSLQAALLSDVGEGSPPRACVAEPPLPKLLMKFETRVALFLNLIELGPIRPQARHIEVRGHRFARDICAHEPRFTFRKQCGIRDVPTGAAPIRLRIGTGFDHVCATRLRASDKIEVDPIPRTGMYLILKSSQVQGCPRRRSALGANRPTRWATRVRGRDLCARYVSFQS